jgi:hypothetical protein
MKKISTWDAARIPGWLLFLGRKPEKIKNDHKDLQPIKKKKKRSPFYVREIV